MPVLDVHHLTTYRYKQPVSLGEHRMMLRPRESYDQRLIEARLVIAPQPAAMRWLHDVFGNSVAIASFAGRAQELRFENIVRLEHSPADPVDFPIEEHARRCPFSYGAEEMPDLMRFIERHYSDPGHELDRWVRRFLRTDGPTDTRQFLTDLTEAIRQSFTYVAREERGIQEPTKTLRLGSGSCRDFAVLMMEAVRSIGLAARFVSGYLHSPGRGSRTHVGGGSMHAWAQVYLPGAGWVEFDPTNGIIGNRDLIRVAVARDPTQAVPISGAWSGFPSDSLGMTVEVHVTSVEPDDARTVFVAERASAKVLP